MLIFCIDLEQVEETKRSLSINFEMKYMREANVILEIRIKMEQDKIMVTQFTTLRKFLRDSIRWIVVRF